jgi:hypothetical protein
MVLRISVSCGHVWARVGRVKWAIQLLYSGKHSHYDGFFAYNIKCGHCSTVFEMPQDVGSLLKKSKSSVDCVLEPEDY